MSRSRKVRWITKSYIPLYTYFDRCIYYLFFISNAVLNIARIIRNSSFHIFLYFWLDVFFKQNYADKGFIFLLLKRKKNSFRTIIYKYNNRFFILENCYPFEWSLNLLLLMRHIFGHVFWCVIIDASRVKYWRR